MHVNVVFTLSIIELQQRGDKLKKTMDVCICFLTPSRFTKRHTDSFFSHFFIQQKYLLSNTHIHKLTYSNLHGISHCTLCL